MVVYIFRILNMYLTKKTKRIKQGSWVRRNIDEDGLEADSITSRDFNCVLMDLPNGDSVSYCD